MEVPVSEYALAWLQSGSSNNVPASLLDALSEMIKAMKEKHIYNLYNSLYLRLVYWSRSKVFLRPILLILDGLSHLYIYTYI